MATIAERVKTPLERERAFFFYMAIAMSVLIVAAFSLDLGLGRSSFSMPLIYHAHALVFFGWVVLYLTQTGLVATGSLAMHRRLGWLALAWIPAMVAMGTALTLFSIRHHGGPPFFDANEFLFGNPLGILAFAGLALGGIALRNRTAWHRRLMCCAMISITGPAFGRLLPMPFLIPWAWWISAVVTPAIFVVIGMAFDKRRRGGIHPAWYWGLAVLAGSQIIADAIAYSPFGYSITHAVIDGTPGAQRDMPAHFP